MRRCIAFTSQPLRTTPWRARPAARDVVGISPVNRSPRRFYCVVSVHLPVPIDGHARGKRMRFAHQPARKPEAVRRRVLRAMAAERKEHRGVPSPRLR